MFESVGSPPNAYYAAPVSVVTRYKKHLSDAASSLKFQSLRLQSRVEDAMEAITLHSRRARPRRKLT